MAKKANPIKAISSALATEIIEAQHAVSNISINKGISYPLYVKPRNKLKEIILDRKYLADTVQVVREHLEHLKNVQQQQKQAEHVAILAVVHRS